MTIIELQSDETRRIHRTGPEGRDFFFRPLDDTIRIWDSEAGATNGIELPDESTAYVAVPPNSAVWVHSEVNDNHFDWFRGPCNELHESDPIHLREYQDYRVGIWDSTGTRIDPAEKYYSPGNDKRAIDLSAGDYTAGPHALERSQAVVIAGEDNSGNSWSADIDWRDHDDNILFRETASDISLSGVSGFDWSRVVRKGDHASVTFSGTSTDFDFYVDSHR